LLAPAARVATSRRLGPAASQVVGTTGPGGPARLESRSAGFAVPAGKKGGELTGPNPTDKGRPGSKQHLVVERGGIPLAAAVSAANLNDHFLFEPLLDEVPAVGNGRPGRPRCRPEKVHADKAYDQRCCRAACRIRGIVPRIARRGVESSERLGRYRWVIERTFAWLTRFRRLSIRYERFAQMHLALLTLGCALICFRALHDGF
jgi:transposase